MVHSAATLTLALNYFFEHALSISHLLAQTFPRYEKQGLSKKLGGGGRGAGPYVKATSFKIENIELE
jgi:hypothetical protein